MTYTFATFYNPEFFSFFFNDPATTEIYTLSLHDALPIYASMPDRRILFLPYLPWYRKTSGKADRKSTRLNSSHTVISYAVFCLKKIEKQAGTRVERFDGPCTHHLPRDAENM